MATFPPLLLVLLLTTTPTLSHPPKPTTTTLSPTTIHTICQTTPHPSSCLASTSNIKTSLTSISIPLLPPNILSVALGSLHAALTAVSGVSPLLSSSLSGGTAIPRRGAAQDCLDLHAATLASLSRSASLLAGAGEHLPAVRAHLAAALTNKATCLDSLAGAQGPRLGDLLTSLAAAYEHVSNSLSLVAGHGRSTSRLHNRRLLQDDDDDNGGDDSGNGDEPATTVITVAKDGTGNYRTVGEAVAAAPNDSDTRTVIAVKAGTYDENVEVPIYKTNIVLLGEGRDVTVIAGSRSVGDGWTTFRTATVAVAAEGFLARDITFRNTAGPGKGQAVALRINADLAAAYRCSIDGYQDTLYVHSFRQFYRECDISGTVDMIFGNAAAVLQGCNIVAKNPIPGQANVITAQGRDDPNEDTGISIQNCTVTASGELISSNVSTRTYLGRPWRPYSRAVFIESYLDALIDQAGWTPWAGNESSANDLLYYGEYSNDGPGAATDGRVDWPGYHVMEYDEAAGFSVENFIYGDEWLSSTSFPYDDGI